MAQTEATMLQGETVAVSMVTQRMIRAARAVAVQGIKKSIETEDIKDATHALRGVLYLLGLAVDEEGDELPLDHP